MINALSKYNVRTVDTHIDPEIHKTPEAVQLKDACQQFESILWSKLWKEMKSSAQAISGHAEGRPWKQMEDLSLEMASDDLVSSSGGAGLWQMLYDSMITKVAADQKAREIKAADDEAKKLYGPDAPSLSLRDISPEEGDFSDNIGFEAQA